MTTTPSDIFPKFENLLFNQDGYGKYSPIFNYCGRCSEGEDPFLESEDCLNVLCETCKKFVISNLPTVEDLLQYCEQNTKPTFHTGFRYASEFVRDNPIFIGDTYSVLLQQYEKDNTYFDKMLNVVICCLDKFEPKNFFESIVECYIDRYEMLNIYVPTSKGILTKRAK